LKILLVSTSVFPCPPASYGGTEWIVHLLAEELAKRGHEITVASPSGSHFSDSIRHVDTGPANLDGGTGEDAAWPKIQPLLLDGGQPAFDLVHDHSLRAYSYTVAMERPEVRVAYTMHGLPHWQNPSPEALGEIAGPPPVSHPNLIALSHAHAQACSALLGRHFEVAYNGIPMDAYPMKAEKSDRFLFLGRITKGKGAHEAVEIARRLQLPLDVAGGDRFVDDPRYVQDVIAMCRPPIRYWGEVSRARKLELLQNARALLQPLVWSEPFGLTTVEALACGTPVIALDYPGSAIREIVRDGVNGFLCKTIDEMAAAARNAGDIKPEACRRTVEEKFTAAKMAERYESLYARAADGGW
jgi:glycosyltransferase involved in cell wall biosynthesis